MVDWLTAEDTRIGASTACSPDGSITGRPTSIVEERLDPAVAQARGLKQVQRVRASAPHIDSVAGGSQAGDAFDGWGLPASASKDVLAHVFRPGEVGLRRLRNAIPAVHGFERGPEAVAA